MVNHDIVGLYVSVHNSFRMAKVQSLQIMNRHPDEVMVVYTFSNSNM